MIDPCGVPDPLTALTMLPRSARSAAKSTSGRLMTAPHARHTPILYRPVNLQGGQVVTVYDIVLRGHQ